MSRNTSQANLLFQLLLLGFLLIQTLIASADQNNARVITMALAEDPPWLDLHGQEPSGIAIDLIEAITEHLSYQIQPVYLPARRSLNHLLQNKVDFMPAFYLPELFEELSRDSNIKLSDTPIYMIPLVATAKSDSDFTGENFDQLKETRIGVGGALAIYTELLAPQISPYWRTPNHQNLIKGLMLDRIDIALMLGIAMTSSFTTEEKDSFSILFSCVTGKTTLTTLWSSNSSEKDQAEFESALQTLRSKGIIREILSRYTDLQFMANFDDNRTDQDFRICEKNTSPTIKIN